MRKLLAVFAFALAVSAASSAEAGFVLEGSVGKGIQINPEPRDFQPTNIMVAPGYSLLGLLRLQLGVVADLPDVKNSDFDLQLRPMIGIYPPILPIYGRAIFAVTNLLDDPTIGIGGAIGFKLGLPVIGLGVFAEAGVIPVFVESKTTTLLEGRLGAFWDF
jgi:hypothetical protein